MYIIPILYIGVHIEARSTSIPCPNLDEARIALAAPNYITSTLRLLDLLKLGGMMAFMFPWLRYESASTCKRLIIKKSVDDNGLKCL